MAEKISTYELWEKIQRGDDFNIVEVLAEREWKKLHIVGSTCIPFGKIVEEAKRRFGRNEEIVLYCFDPECKASPLAAKKLEAFGFSSVKEYPGGKEEWKREGLPMEGSEIG